MNSYQAGCRRTWDLLETTPELIYADLVFAECQTCQHKVQPETHQAFCLLKPVDTAHPFASLAGLHVPDE